MSARKISKVIVAGVGGTLGAPVIKQLLSKGFEVTALTSKPEQVKEAYKDEVRACKADYSSVDTLTPSLQNYDALVILLNRTALEAQTLLIDAAVAAGVPHIVPSCFGQDSSIPEWRTNPALEEKIKMEDHVVKLAHDGKITFTGIQTGLFLDWALRVRVVLNCQGDGPTMLFDGGDTPLSTTSLDDIGRAVANALVESGNTKNRFLRVHSAVVTQHRLLEYGRKARPQWKWQTVDVNTEEIYKKSKDALDRGERNVDLMRGFIAWPTFGQGLGLFGTTDNELLGIQVWSEDRLVQLISDVIDEVAVV